MSSDGGQGEAGELMAQGVSVVRADRRRGAGAQAKAGGGGAMNGQGNSQAGR